VRSLLRWTSLVVAGAILYGVGARRLHLHDFNTFLALLLVLALAITAVFVVTRDEAGE
jgi:hypothetical protein